MSAIDDIQDKFDKYSKACSLMIDRDEWLAVFAEIESLRQERDGLRDLIIKTMNSYVKEMEGYSYFGSNPGIDDDDIEEIADEIIAAMAKEQGE